MPNPFRARCIPRLRRDRDWWAYLGSFGDDFFGDDPDEEADHPSRLTGLAPDTSR